MTGIAETIADLSAALPGPGKLSQQRADALAAFCSHGLPDTAKENWRYTDITSLDRADLSFATPQQSVDPRVDLLPIDADRIVFVNGQLCDSQTQIESARTTQIEILGADWSPLADGFPLNGDVVEHPLGQLNTATAQHGVLIATQPGDDQPRAINIVLAHSGETALALQPRIVLDLAERSSARVVLHYVSDAAAAGWMNTVVEIRQAPESRLDFVQLQVHGSSQTQTALISGVLERSAVASIASFDLGARLARNDIDVRLDGPGSEVDVFGAFAPMQAQHIDTHVRTDHAAPHTSSSATFRGIAGEASRGVFASKVIVRPDAQKISAEQRSDNLLLSADAEIDTKPELEIYADDVRCSHGATVGELDERHLFYLRSRGIDDAAARALLTYAFAQSIVERISDETLRNIIAEQIAHRLPEHERWERLT